MVHLDKIMQSHMGCASFHIWQELSDRMILPSASPTLFLTMAPFHWISLSFEHTIVHLYPWFIGTSIFFTIARTCWILSLVWYAVKTWLSHTFMGHFINFSFDQHLTPLQVVIFCTVIYGMTSIYVHRTILSTHYILNQLGVQELNRNDPPNITCERAWSKVLFEWKRNADTRAMTIVSALSLILFLWSCTFHIGEPSAILSKHTVHCRMQMLADANT